MGNIRTNDGFDSWSAIKIGAVALGGLAALGAVSKGVSLGTREYRAMAGRATGSLFDLGGLGTNLRGASRLARTGMARKGYGGGISAGLGGIWRGLGSWATAGSMIGQQGRLGTAAVRMGAIGVGAYAGSFLNPFVSSENRGTLTGTLQTGLMAGAGLAVGYVGKGLYKGGRIRNRLSRLSAYRTGENYGIMSESMGMRLADMNAGMRGAMQGPRTIHPIKSLEDWRAARKLGRRR